MDIFLGILYKKYFNALDNEQKFRDTHPKEHDENIRNDQSISESYKTTVMIRKLIEEYMRLNYDGK